MAKKVLLLVLCLPIIIMICLFTTTDAVSLAIDIPVTGIDIVEDNIVYLDLDEEESYKVDYTTYEYNTFMGYGGIRYMSYNYDNYEWAKVVKKNKGQLDYK